MTEHTPTPWTIYDESDPHHIKVKGIRPDVGGAHVASVLFPENASFLLKAVNNHDALVKALEKIAAMDPKGIRADDLGRAARIAAEGIAGAVGSSPDSGK